jgi:hypothetical protein
VYFEHARCARNRNARWDGRQGKTNLPPSWNAAPLPRASTASDSVTLEKRK